MKPRHHIYLTMAAGIVTAACVLTASALLRIPHLSREMKYVFAAIPVPAYAFLLWAIVRSVRAMDEMQRRIQLEAYATALVGTLLTTIGYGFLQKVGMPHENWAWVSIVVFVFYMIGYFAAARHYR